MNYMDYTPESQIEIIGSMYRDSDSSKAKDCYVSYIKQVIELRPKKEHGLLKKLWQREMEL